MVQRRRRQKDTQLAQSRRDRVCDLALPACQHDRILAANCKSLRSTSARSTSCSATANEDTMTANGLLGRCLR